MTLPEGEIVFVMGENVGTQGLQLGTPSRPKTRQTPHTHIGQRDDVAQGMDASMLQGSEQRRHLFTPRQAADVCCREGFDHLGLPIIADFAVQEVGSMRADVLYQAHEGLHTLGTDATPCTHPLGCKRATSPSVCTSA